MSSLVTISVIGPDSSAKIDLCNHISGLLHIEFDFNVKTFKAAIQIVANSEGVILKCHPANSFKSALETSNVVIFVLGEELTEEAFRGISDTTIQDDIGDFKPFVYSARYSPEEVQAFSATMLKKFGKRGITYSMSIELTL